MKVVVCFSMIVLLGVIACSPKPQQTYSFDFSAIGPFWALMDTLQTDTEPSDGLWEEMLETPGYKTLIAREFPEDWIKSYLRHGIMPSAQAEYQEWVTKGYWDTIFPYHMKQVFLHREEIMEFRRVVDDPKFIRRANSIAKEYWPNEKVPDGFPPISFLFFSMDARGYDPVILDLYYALDKYRKGGLVELIAHEFHHYYRNKVLSFSYPEGKDPDYIVIHTLDQVHLEGLADQMDKVHSLANPYYAKQNERYQKNLKTTPDDMRRLDSLLVEYSCIHDSCKAEIAKQISRAVPNSGHPMGYFMSTTMKNFESLDYMLEDIGNPFQFFLRYNNLAKKSLIDVPVFSEEAIQAIIELSKKYQI